jgi:hypothetical protein
MSEAAIDNAFRVITSLPCSVVLPAGCGKTELVAALGRVASTQSRRLLILTHTNAGVSVLRHRLYCYGVASKAATVRTIDSWCQFLCTSFPMLAGVGEETPGGNRYAALNTGAAAVLQHKNICRLMSLSYDYLVVDEYQDTNLLQHAAVLAASAVLPTVVLGDPLQGIYGWAANPIVSWEDHVLPSFPPLELELVPWRWIGRHDALGQWLLAVREPLFRSEAISLAGAPVVTWGSDTPGQISACYDALKVDVTTVAIHNIDRQCHRFGRQLGGRYGVMEELECRVLESLISGVAGGGNAAAASLLGFARQCASGLKAPLDDNTATKFRTGREVRYVSSAAAGRAMAALCSVRERPTATAIRNALREVRAVAGVKVFRREAWHAAEQSLRLWERSPGSTLADCAVNVRNRTSLLGRFGEKRTISRTLLVKGQEFGQCIVLDADGMNARNLYVALTRASDRLVVCSNSRALTPMSF